MTTPRLTCAAALLAAMVLTPTLASTQQIALRASPGVVVGVVTDTASNPVDADVSFDGAKNRVSTGSDGRFRFEDIKPGKYVIAARRVGFYPRAATVTISDSGAIVHIKLVPLPNRLPPVITSAERGGLSGVIGDNGLRLIHGAEVYVVGSNRRAKTDSAGEFHFPLSAGKYMVKISRPGFATRLLSVTVPVFSGKRMEVMLEPSEAGASRRDEAAARSLQERLIRRNAAYSKLFTAEDIEKVGFKTLGQIASSGAVQYVDNTCPVMLPAYTETEQIEGMSRGSVPLWSLDAADLEFVEVYTTKPARNTQKSIRSGPRVARPSAAPRCPMIVAWLKK